MEEKAAAREQAIRAANMRFLCKQRANNTTENKVAETS